MSPVCGAACVIDMLTVNVIGGADERVSEGGNRGGHTDASSLCI